jgi:hypothetical protein
MRRPDIGIMALRHHIVRQLQPEVRVAMAMRPSTCAVAQILGQIWTRNAETANRLARLLAVREDLPHGFRALQYCQSADRYASSNQTGDLSPDVNLRKMGLAEKQNF